MKLKDMGKLTEATDPICSNLLRITDQFRMETKNGVYISLYTQLNAYYIFCVLLTELRTCFVLDHHFPRCTLGSKRTKFDGLNGNTMPLWDMHPLGMASCYRRLKKRRGGKRVDFPYVETKKRAWSFHIVVKIGKCLNSWRICTVHFPSTFLKMGRGDLKFLSFWCFCWKIMLLWSRVFS